MYDDYETHYSLRYLDVGCAVPCVLGLVNTSSLCNSSVLKLYHPEDIESLLRRYLLRYQATVEDTEVKYSAHSAAGRQ